MAGFAIFRQDELAWEPRGGDDPRSRVPVSDALSQSRANFHKLPPGSVGRRHRDLGQEEVFVVLEGEVTSYVGEPPERVDLPAGSVLAVDRGTPRQLRNESDAEALLFIYGAPSADSNAEFLPDAF
jgi:mannose-6-phosphate isomerase-like protein (cupin superfamily)